MKQILLSLIVLAANVFVSSAQNVDYFKEIPGDLTEYYQYSEVMMEESHTSRFDELTRSDGLLINDIARSGSMFTRSLHSSGKVIFNCLASQYLEELKDNLLKDYPKVKEMINVFITKDPALNAFATVNNNIYVNIGLLAKVQNEAQLSYILAHEIMHIVNAHIINQTLDVSAEESNYGKKDLLLKEDIIQIYRHSLAKEHENEADIDGLRLFLKQNYSSNEALRALELLKSSGSLNVSLPLSAEALFADTESFKQILETLECSKGHLENETSNGLSTHPLIEDRIANVAGLVNSLENTHEGVQFIVSEDRFNAIKLQANNAAQSFYADNLNFITLFELSAYKYHIEEDRSEENINYLNYALQGILLDNLKDVAYRYQVRANATDSAFYYFLKNTNDVDIARWTYNAMKSIKTDNPKHFNNDYYDALLKNIYIKHKSSLIAIFGDTSGINFTGSLLVEDSISYDAINFSISPRVDMLWKEIRKFNDSYGEKNGEGKIAILGMNNIKIRVKPMLNEFTINPIDIEKLDFRTNKVWRNLEEDYEDEIVSLIPNDVLYSNERYEILTELNHWLNKTLHYGNYNFVYLHQQELDSVLNKMDIRYTFSSINIEVKNFSIVKGIIFWFGLIPMPHYIPQMAANIITENTRKYQLSLIFDIKTKQLVFYDKRTYTEPNTIGQLHMIYNNIFDKFLNR